VKLMLPLLLVIALSASAESALVLERLEYTDHGKSGSELESPLEVRLTSARSGNPVPDYPVYFAVTGGSAELLPAEGCLTLSGEPSEGLVVHTDSSGIARVGLCQSTEKTVEDCADASEAKAAVKSEVRRICMANRWLEEVRPGPLVPSEMRLGGGCGQAIRKYRVRRPATQSRQLGARCQVLGARC